MKRSVLDQHTSDPLYAQITQKLKNDISSGVFPAGSRIPSETVLCSTYHVSRVTVRRALSDLASEGFLEKKQGKGTFVTSKRMNHGIKAVSSFHDTCRLNGMNPASEVICKKERPADENDIMRLKLQQGSHVIETIRVNSADGQPVVLEINHFSMAYSYLLEADLNGSLYGILQEYGISPAGGLHDISLCMADETVSELLSIKKGTPLILLEEVIFDKLGRPLHTSKQYIRGEKLVVRI